jgi:NADH-quinone oxidoreductase subunit C
VAPEEVLSILRDQFPDEILALAPAGVHPHAVVKPHRWRDMARFLRDEPRLRFDWLRCVSAVDHLEDQALTIAYDLHATQPPAEGGPGRWAIHAEVCVKVRVDRDAPRVPSVADLWPAANWHEREAFDLLGVVFEGHPDLRRILCCEDWVGHPLRKDYEFPLEYHGIPAVTEHGQTRPQH